MRASLRQTASRTAAAAAGKTPTRPQEESEDDDDIELADAMDVSPAPEQKKQVQRITRGSGSNGSAGPSMATAAGTHAAAKTPASKAARTHAAASPSPMDVSPCPAAGAGGSMHGASPMQAHAPTTAPFSFHAPQSSTAATITAPACGSPAPVPLACQPLQAADILRSRLLSRSGCAAPLLSYPTTRAPSASSSSSARPPAPAPASWALPLRPSLQAAHDTLVATLGRVVREEGCTAAVLLLGERGTGKTLVVERALQTLAAQQSPSANPTGAAPGAEASSSSAAAAAAAGAAAAGVPGEGDKLVGVVRISGLLHLEERVAFQEIARQLCAEFQQLFAKSATYDQNLAFLRNMLQALHRCMKTVVFVVDELDAFTRKGKQMLLYNLLDTLAHSKVQACVVGISCMQDVMDHMEKRVRSRFSAQRILVTPPLEFDPRAPQAAAAAGASARASATASQAQAAGVPTEDTPLGILKAMLSLPAITAGTAGPSGRGGSAAGAVTAGRGTAGGVTAGMPAGQGLDPGFVQRHNGSVATALQDAAVKAVLKQAFNIRLRPRDLANIAQCALLEWTLEVQQQQGQQQLQQATQQGRGKATVGPTTAATVAEVALSSTHVLKAVQQHMAVHASQGDQLAGLSVLQLFLVVAMYRLAVKGSDLVNFEMAYEELRCIQMGSGSSRGDEQYKWSRGAALRAFQGLLLSGIAAQVGGGQSGERVVGRGAAFAGAELRAGKSVVEGALRAKGNACPELLLRFFRMDV